jgi:hypothetical protein
MARAVGKRVTTTTVETGDENTELDLSGSESAPVLDEISQLLGLEGIDEIQWVINCVSPPSKAGFCANYDGSSLSLTRIQEEFGGGKYQIRGKRSDGTFAGQRTITIVDRGKRESIGADQIGAMIEKSKREGSGSDSMMLQFMAMMQAQQKASTDILIAMMNKPVPVPPPGPDPLAMIAALQSILAPAKSADGGAEAAVSMLLKGVSLGEKIAGNGGDGMSGLLGQGLETAKAAFEAARAAPQPQAAPQAQPQPAVAAPQPQAAPQAQPQPAVAAPSLEDQKSAWFAATCRWLLALAAKAKAPHIYAPVFIDNLPPFVTEEEILAQFDSPEAVNLLMQFEPLLKPYGAWLEAFRCEVLAMYSEDLVEPAQSPDDGGHTDSSGVFVPA